MVKKTTNQKNKKQFDPFKNLVLNEYEKEIEKSLEQGEWKSVDGFEERKKEVEEAAQNTLDIRKTKKITFRINQGDLIRLKARAEKRSIPYQTLLTALIRDYIDGEYTVRI